MKMDMDVDTPSVGSSTVEADLVVLSWNIEHLRAIKLVRTTENFLTVINTISRAHVVFLYEAHTKIGEPIATSLEVFAGGNWKGESFSHFDEYLTVVWNTDVVLGVEENKGVTVECQKAAITGFRYPKAFNVALKSGDNLVIAGWHAPGPAMAMAQLCIQRLCSVSSLDLFVGDFNFEPHLDQFGASSARRSTRVAETYPIKEVTADVVMPSTYTAMGLSKTRNGPLDRCFANDRLGYDVVVEIVQPVDYKSAKELTDHCPLFAYLKKK